VANELLTADIMYNYLTETEVVDCLKTYLEKKRHACICRYGNQHGYDVEATKGNYKVLIEAKGAKANRHQGDKKSRIFSKGQLKTHFSVAILKALHMKNDNPGADIGIAHPSTVELRNLIEPFIHFLKELEIKHYWVMENGKVEIE